MPRHTTPRRRPRTDRLRYTPGPVGDARGTGALRDRFDLLGDRLSGQGQGVELLAEALAE